MKKIKLLIPLLASCSILSACGIVNTNLLGESNKETFTSFRSSGTVNNPFQKKVYFIDEEITVTPKDISYGGKLISCIDFYIIYPDGTQKSGSKFRLNQAGQYSIVYIAEDGGKTIEAIEKISAFKKAYSVVKDASTSEYVDEIICDQNKTSGIQTYLAEGDVWTYNQAIDLSKATYDTPLIKYYTRQSSELAQHVSLDVKSTIIRLTDFYDSTNYVDIYNTYNETNTSTHRQQPYVLAGCYGQPLSGIDLTNRSSKIISYEGVNYYLHNSNKAWGSCLDTVPGSRGIYGTVYSPDIANSDNLGFTVYYDNAKKTISVKHKLMHLVTDLDEPAIYSNNLFKGFTTGEVILSVRCDGYQESQGFFEISEIYGKKGNDLNTEYAFDEIAPVISLNNEVDNFYIANGEPFELFKATATDPNIVGDVSVQVYYDYETSNQRFVPVVDGKFTPNAIGKYSIVYSASDTYGNIAKKVVNCNCITAENNKIVNLKFDPITSADAGTKVIFNQPEVNGYNEGVYYKVKAINEMNNEVVVFDNDNCELFLKYAGEYKIIVEYGDVSCKRIKEYKFTSNKSDNAYLESMTLPKYLIKDAHVTLDNNRVVLCNDLKPSYAKPTVEVVNGGTETVIDPNDYYVDGNGSVQFKYSYGGKEIYVSPSVPIIDVSFNESIEFTKYFNGDLDTTLDENGVSLSTNVFNDDFETEFINPISFNLLNLEIVFDSKSRYRTIDVVMKDYYGIDDDFVISFFYNSNILSFLSNGIKGEIGIADYITMSYDSLNNVLAFGNGVTLPLENPFTNDRFYLGFKITDVTPGEIDEKLFTIRKINNQIISSSVGGSDYTNPQISYTKLKGQRNINTTINIDKTSCCDVLSPYYSKTRKMIVSHVNSLEDKNSTTLKSVDGILLDGSEDLERDYQLLLDKHGVYRIYYTYKDQKGNSVSITETIYVQDNEAPEITINGANSGTIDIVDYGKEVEVRGYSVKDESSTKVTIYAVSPQNKMVRIENNKFKPDMRGDWYIVYYAEDVNYNVASASYILRVK